MHAVGGGGCALCVKEEKIKAPLFGCERSVSFLEVTTFHPS